MDTIKRLKAKLGLQLAIWFPGFAYNFYYRKIVEFRNSNFTIQKNIEPELFFVERFIPTNAVVMDVGANVGQYIFVFNQYAKPARMAAFEPVPVLYKLLKKVFKKSEIYHNAISNYNGPCVLSIPVINNMPVFTRSMVNDQANNNSALMNVTVQAISIDSFLMANPGIEHVDFIKIDVEGHEQKVIEGAVETIRKYKPILFVEIEHNNSNDISESERIQNICAIGYVGYYFDSNELKFKPVKQIAGGIEKLDINPGNYFFFPEHSLPLCQRVMAGIENDLFKLINKS